MKHQAAQTATLDSTVGGEGAEQEPVLGSLLHEAQAQKERMLASEGGAQALRLWAVPAPPSWDQGRQLQDFAEPWTPALIFHLGPPLRCSNASVHPWSSAGGRLLL